MTRLTTGQMIDRLGLEDTAVNQDGYIVGYDHKGNLLMWEVNEEKPEIKEGNEFLVYFPWVRNDTWEIRHHFVSFEEAQRAFADGQNITYVHSDDMEYKFIDGKYDHFERLAKDNIALHELMQGRWIIEN
ncbi:hypothetical protein COE51_01260 [Bacillus pseudomycoides]|nr:hypothetical protein COE51_01260 [Bacillus pseudomycoides]